MQKKRARERIIMFLCIISLLFTPVLAASQSNAMRVLQSPNQKIPDRKTKCVIKTHINIKQNVIFGAKLKPV